MAGVLGLAAVVVVGLGLSAVADRDTVQLLLADRGTGPGLRPGPSTADATAREGWAFVSAGGAAALAALVALLLHLRR